MKQCLYPVEAVGRHLRTISVVLTIAVVLSTLSAVAFPAFANAVGTTVFVAGSGGVYSTPPADTGNCESEESPCATIHYALSHAPDGSTVEVSGTLAQSVGLRVSDDATIEANPDGSSAVITGAGPIIAILGDYTLNLKGLTLENSGGGAIDNGSGGINGGQITITGCTITHNDSDYGGAIVNYGGSMAITSSTISSNYSGSFAGAIDNEGGAKLTITDSTLSNNSAANNGGAIDNNDGMDYPETAKSSVTINDSTLSGNSAAGDGGAIDSNDGGGQGGSVTINDSTLSDNRTVLGQTLFDDGGAIDNNDLTYINSEANIGGWNFFNNPDGISEGGTVTIHNSTLSGNHTGGDGGAIDTNDDGTVGAVVTVTDSTIVDNSAKLAGDAIANAALPGDGTFSGGGFGGKLTLIGSTVAGSIDNGRLSNNFASNEIYVAADVLDGQCSDWGAWHDAGFNAAVSLSCLAPSSGTTDQPTDAVGSAVSDLEALGSNGGLTQTMLPDPGNPGIGLIPSGTTLAAGPGGSVTVSCPTIDQRGFHSVSGAACNAGAVQQAATVTYASGAGGDDFASASDANDCQSPLTPCATIDGALAQTSPGATIELSGTFSEASAASIGASVTIETVPSDPRPATIQGAGGDSDGLLTVSGEFTVNLDDLTLKDGNSIATGGAVTNDAGGSVTISDSTLTDNSGRYGGAIANNVAEDTVESSVTVLDSTLSGNSAVDGGAIDNDDNGSSGEDNAAEVTVEDSTLSGNSGLWGGAIDNDDNGSSGGEVTVESSALTGNQGGLGGAIDQTDRNSLWGITTVRNSLLSGNSAGEGGAIDEDADQGSRGQVQVTASTLTGNSSSNDGGAIDFDNGGGSDGYLIVAQSTVAGNTAPSGTAINDDFQLHTTYGGSVYLAADILAGTCMNHAAQWTDAGYNAATDVSCLGGAKGSTDAPISTAAAGLGALADNGGPTETMLLHTASPAVGLIPSLTNFSTGPLGEVTVSCPSTDQRGEPSLAARCDAGAAQYAQQTISFGSAFTTSAVVGEQKLNFPVSASSGLPVGVKIDAKLTTNSACAVTSSGKLSLRHAGSCVIDASQSGGADAPAAAPVSRTIVVSAARTATRLAAAAGAVKATVSTVAPGGGTPTGTVAFISAGRVVWTAALNHGSATLSHAPPGTSTITADYEGSPDHLASRSSRVKVTGARRNDPLIAAKLTSRVQRNSHGWYRTPVKVMFYCSARRGKLTRRCPAPVTLRSRGNQWLTRTISNTRGGSATITVGGINIDLTTPVVRVSGLNATRSYIGQAPDADCTATDRISGIRTCTVKQSKTKTATGYTIRYTARATSNAGTTAASAVTVRVTSSK